MRVSKTIACLIGVTLSVAPIFSPLWAQQSNQQATLLLEMQALRSEIAELRDMVERQQYQLRQLQRSERQSPGQTAGAPADARMDNAPNALPSPAAVPGGFPAASTTAATDQFEQPVTGTEAIGSEVIDPASVDDSSEEVAPAFADDEADFYQAYPAAQQPGETVGNQQVAGGVVIEERVINQAPATPPTTGQNRFPPVEERTIGQPAYQPEPQIEPQAPAQAQARVQVPTQANANLPADGALVPSSPGNTTGVIAVPAGSRPADDRAYDASQSELPAGPVQTNPGLQNQSVQQNGQAQAVDLANAASTSMPAALSEQDYYQQGFELLKQSKHAQAVDVFKRQIASFPQGSLADDAHYWIAESMYVNRSLDISKQYFRAIIDGFSQSPRLPDAMLKTAYIEQEQGNRIEARILLQEIIQYHPRSNAAISAKNRLAELD